MAHHNKTGSAGEEMAVNYFIKMGYNILHRNWRHSNWEVDIIASLENRLHFIEVKTRRTNAFGYPEEDVSKKKVTNLINAAEEFLFQNQKWKHIQFDILSITMIKNTPVEFFLIEDVAV